MVGVVVKLKKLVASSKAEDNCLYKLQTLLVKGHKNFPLVKGHFSDEDKNLCWNFAKGTNAKAQGSMVIAVGALI